MEGEVFQGKKTSIRMAAIFTVATFAASAIFDYPLFEGKILSDSMWGVMAVMWVPGVIAMTMARLSGIPILSGLGIKRFEIRYAGMALLAPAAYSVLAYGGAFALGACGLDFGHKFALGTMLLPALRGVFNALGEEIGWRGFLFPALRGHLSFGSACLVSGVIWAAWHYPAMIFGNYGGGNTAWWAFLNFTAQILGSTVLTSWLREKSCSIWPAVIAHAAHNYITQRILNPMVVEKAITKYVTTEMGIGLALTQLILAAILWWHYKHSPEPTGKIPV